MDTKGILAAVGVLAAVAASTAAAQDDMSNVIVTAQRSDRSA